MRTRWCEKSSSQTLLWSALRRMSAEVEPTTACHGGGERFLATLWAARAALLLLVRPPRRLSVSPPLTAEPRPPAPQRRAELRKAYVKLT